MLARLLCLVPPPPAAAAAPDALREASIAAVALILGVLLTHLLSALSRPHSGEARACSDDDTCAPAPLSRSASSSSASPRLVSNPEGVLELLRARRSVTTKDYTGQAIPEQASATKRGNLHELKGRVNTDHSPV